MIRKLLCVIILTGLMISCTTTENETIPERWRDVPVEGDADMFSYSYGWMIADELLVKKTRLNGDYFAKGVIDYSYGLEPFADNAKLNETYSNWTSGQGNFSTPETVTISENFNDFLLIPEPQASHQMFSYAFGHLIIYNVVNKGYTDINPLCVIRGVLDRITESTPVIEKGLIHYVYNQENEKVIQASKKEYEELKERNRIASENFFSSNAAVPGVHTTRSGLQYRFEKTTDGTRVKGNDTVIVSYTLNDLKGNTIDSQTGAKIEIASMSSKSGLKQALLLMNEGETMIAYIPPALAYGEDGGGVTEPYMPLVAEIIIREIKK